MNTQIFDLACRQIVQVSLVIVAVAVLTRVFCRQRPHLAYLLWLLVLVKAVTPPIWSSPIGVFSWTSAQPVVASAPAPIFSPISANVIPAAGATSIMSPVTAQPSPWNAVNILLCVWAMGFAALLLIVAVRSSALARRIRSASMPIPADVSQLAESLQKSLGLRRRISITLCSEPIGPAVFGIFRPTLVLPAVVLDDPKPGQLRALLTHELIHLRRRDPLVAGAQVLIQALWWFHPFVWWVNRQIGQVREMCCDAEVIGDIQCRREDYAQMLVDVLRRRRLFQPMLISVGVRPMQVTTRRLNQVLSGRGWSHRRTPWKYWIAVAVCGYLILPGAVSQLRHPIAAVSAQEISSTPDTQPPATQPTNSLQWKVEHSVRVVVGVNFVTFQGKVVTLDQLPAVFDAVPNREDTVLELAYASDQVTMARFAIIQGQILNDAERTRLGFKYISEVGLQPAMSLGTPDRRVAVANTPAATVPSDDALPVLHQASIYDLTHFVPFQLGRTQFAQGDNITISVVRGTADTILKGETYMVEGNYHLASCDEATIALYVTAKRREDGRQETAPSQWATIHKGDGKFALRICLPCDGYPHVSFYNMKTRSNIGGVYFGTGESVYQ